MTTLPQWHWPQWCLAVLILVGALSGVISMYFEKNEQAEVASWKGSFVWMVVAFLTYAGGFWQ